MKSTKEKIGLIMLAITAIGSLLWAIIGAFLYSETVGLITIGGIIWSVSMVILIFNEYPNIK